MDLFKEIILIFLSSLGIIAGFIVSKNAEEELSDGKKHFRVVYLISIFLILAYTFFIAFNNPIIASFVPTVYILSTFYLFKKYNYYINAGIIGLAFGFLLSKTENYIIPSVLFFFLMIHGTLIYIESHKHKKNVNIQGLINSSIFMAFAIIALFLFNKFF